jgi:multidrug efflux pump subunit AcrB
VILFPKVDPGEALISIRGAQGTHIDETNRIVGILEQRVDGLRKNPRGFDNFDEVVANAGYGGGDGGFLSGSSFAPHRATISIIFPDYENRKEKSRNITTKLRDAVKNIPGAEIRIKEQEKGPPLGAAVSIQIAGEDMKVLEQISNRIMGLIRDVPNLVNLRSNQETARPELIFVPDRKRIARLGITTATISNFLKTAIYGSKVGTYRQFNDEYDIRLRLPVENRDAINDILRLRVPNKAGEGVPIGSLGYFEYAPGLGTIHRLDRKRLVTITGDTEGRSDEAVLGNVKKILAAKGNLKLPAGYKIEFAGKNEDQQEAKTFLFKAFGLALLLIVAILVTQFNTLTVPLIIMTTVILSLIGVFVGLLLFNTPFGIIMTGVGIISLAGVVVNNAIVLLDYTRLLQRRGHTLIDAAIEAGVTRLRPVLLTAATTILSLIPMATGVSFDFHTMSMAPPSESNEWWGSMAIAVIFGLSVATLLTLFVVPSLYVMLYRLTAKFGLGGLQKVEGDKDKDKPVLEDF